MQGIGHHNEVQKVEQLSELVDTQVIDSRGKAVGAVDELILNCRTGRVERVIVKTPDRSRFSVAWADLNIERHQFVLKRKIRPRETKAR